MAGCRFSRGINDGTTDCQAGPRNAAPVPMAKVNRISVTGVTCSCITRTARSATITDRLRLIVIRRRRLSSLSARLPASRAKRNIGRVVAACTSDTIPGDGSSVVINQPAPTSCIQVPMFDIRPAVHSSANARKPNGDQGETAACSGTAPAPRVSRALIVVLRLRLTLQRLAVARRHSNRRNVGLATRPAELPGEALPGRQNRRHHERPCHS